MKISDILLNQIKPFEIDDVKLQKIFSFFLHSAPTIDSNTAIHIEKVQLEKNWDNFISDFKDLYKIISSNCTIEKYLCQYNLDEDASINRKNKGFVCKRKNKEETDYECVLRHIRNAIAHNYVYMINAGNRKYLLLEDFNKSKSRSSRILMSQTDLQRLKNEIVKQ